MENRFIQLCNRIGIKENANSLYRSLFSRYSEPNRFYHNMRHISNCLKEFDSARHLLQNPNSVEFAIWYHDAIYDTRAKDSEERSAQLAHEVCISARIPDDFANETRDLILATKHNFIPRGIDARLLIDVDLSILGRPTEEFDEYERKIKREYSWVPETKFIQGRSQILQGFLDRDSVYLTDFFRERYEFQARRNLHRSIEALY